MPINEIATTCKVSWFTVWRIAKKEGIFLRHRKRLPRCCVTQTEDFRGNKNENDSRHVAPRGRQPSSRRDTHAETFARRQQPKRADHGGADFDCARAHKTDSNRDEEL